MIKGIGTDIVQISRIRASINKLGDAFAERILHENEFKLYQETTQNIHYLAKRFAAKEAFSKALGTGIRNGVDLKDIEVVNNEMGKPAIILHGNTQVFAASKAVKNIELSLSDEKEYAIAFVVLVAG